MLKAYVGDPVEVHALVTPGSEQMHVFGLGGESWPLDPFLPGSNEVQARGIGPWETLQADIRAGAGGGTTVGDIFYGDLRRPFTDAGMWGIQRVMSDASCPIRPLDGRGCVGGAGTFVTLDASPPAVLITHTIPAAALATTPVVTAKQRPASGCALHRGRGAGARSRSSSSRRGARPRPGPGRGASLQARAGGHGTTGGRRQGEADAGTRGVPAAMTACDDRDGARLPPAPASVV